MDIKEWNDKLQKVKEECTELERFYRSILSDQGYSRKIEFQIDSYPDSRGSFEEDFIFIIKELKKDIEHYKRLYEKYVAIIKEMPTF